MKTVEIFAIGDELLRGIVQESNSHWIAKRIAARGAALRRIVVLPDEPDVVAAELKRGLKRDPTVLITHGGLGPTDDDRTRDAIARGLGVRQERNAEAEAIVRRRYAELAAEGSVADASLTDARARMADLPRGARALDNQVGTAPAFLLKKGPATIVALPGVPPELFWIWENPLAPIMDKLLGPGGFAEETIEVELRDESSIAGLLQMVQQRHPDEYVKSRARGFAEGDEVRVTLHATENTDEQARALITSALQDLRAALAAEGIALR